MSDFWSRLGNKYGAVPVAGPISTFGHALTKVFKSEASKVQLLSESPKDLCKQ